MVSGLCRRIRAINLLVFVRFIVAFLYSRYCETNSLLISIMEFPILSCGNWGMELSVDSKPLTLPYHSWHIPRQAIPRPSRFSQSQNIPIMITLDYTSFIQISPIRSGHRHCGPVFHLPLPRPLHRVEVSQLTSLFRCLRK